MLGLDTNVLIRYLVRDDEAQFRKARRLIRRELSTGEDVFVSLPVLLETEWVLRSRYAMNKEQILLALSSLLDASDLRFEDEPTVEETLFVWKESKADFADCLAGAHHRRLGCRTTATFDARATRLSSFSLI